MSASLEAAGWESLPEALEIRPGAIDLVAADLDRVVDGLTDSLSAPERERRERLVKAQDGVQWARQRGLLRSLLAPCLGVDPAELELGASHRGKPAVGRAVAGRVRFSVSRSDRFALYAIAADREVGVDIEARERPLRELAIARRAFPEAVASLSTLDGPELRREFLRLWVRHEAQVKCLGTGLAHPPSAAERAVLWTSELDLGPGIFAAVAADGDRPREVRRWLANR